MKKMDEERGILRIGLRSLIITSLLLFFTIFSTAQDEDYEVPPDPEGVDLQAEVAQVGDEIITLDDFRDRVRYERFYYYFFIDRLIEDNGETVLDFDDPANQLAGFVRSLVDNLAQDDAFAEPILDVMVRERLYAQEAENREVEIDQCDIDRYWALLLNEQDTFINCELPEGFDERLETFLTNAERYTGHEREDIERAIESRAKFDAVRAALGEELEIEDVTTVQTRQIRVEDEETANEIVERLQNGEDFQELLLEYTLDEGVRGSGGDLGTFRRGTPIAGLTETSVELEDAIFSASVGDTVGPIETELGFHVVEILDQTSSIRARHILLASEEEANTAIDLLERGNDFGEIAAAYSLDTGSGAQGGDLGFFERGMMVPPFEEAAFGAEIGEIVGPIQTDFGYHIIEVTEIAEDPTSVDARHIVVPTEDEAQDVIERLDAGEDFAELAFELSIDPQATGHQGDTLWILSGGFEQGFYSEEDTLPELAEVVFDAEVGDIIGPIETLLGGYLVVEVQDFSSRPPSDAQINQLRERYALEWQEEQIESDRVQINDIWRSYIPHDPVPSVVYEELAPLDEAIVQATEEYEAFKEQTNLLNTLRDLTLPDDDTSESE